MACGSTLEWIRCTIFFFFYFFFLLRYVVRRGSSQGGGLPTAARSAETEKSTSSGGGHQQRRWRGGGGGGGGGGSHGGRQQQQCCAARSTTRTQPVFQTVETRANQPAKATKGKVLFFSVVFFLLSCPVSGERWRSILVNLVGSSQALWLTVCFVSLLDHHDRALSHLAGFSS